MWKEVRFKAITYFILAMAYLFVFGMAVSMIIAMFDPANMKAHPIWMWGYSIVMLMIAVGAPFVFRGMRKSAERRQYWFIVINATLITIVSALRLFIL